MRDEAVNVVDFGIAEMKKSAWCGNLWYAEYPETSACQIHVVLLVVVTKFHYRRASIVRKSMANA